MYKLGLSNLIIVLTLAILTACSESPTNSTISTGDLDFTTYVALGNSLTAGVSNGALYADAQINSYPALIARRVDIPDFEQPTMADSGFSFLPTEGRIVINPLTMAIRFSHAGSEANASLNRAYNNLGIPAIRTDQMFRATTGVDADSNHFVDKILRNHGRTVLEEALTLDPTVITLWVGNNDILEAAVQGMSAASYTPPTEFAAQLDSVLSVLNTQTDAPIIAANIPDVTQVPYFTSIPSYVRNPVDSGKVYLYGMVNGAPQRLTDNDYVLFFALPDFYALQDSMNHGQMPGPESAISDTLVLDATEVAEVRAVIAAYNQSIAAALAADKIDALVDINSLFNDLRVSGYTFENGLTYTSALIGFDNTGMIQLRLATTLFSLDGLHPNSIGYAIVANAFIDAMNANFNASIPAIKLSDLQ